VAERSPLVNNNPADWYAATRHTVQIFAPDLLDERSCWQRNHQFRGKSIWQRPGTIEQTSVLPCNIFDCEIRRRRKEMWSVSTHSGKSFAVISE
jgi:hypothetical protein